MSKKKRKDRSAAGGADNDAAAANPFAALSALRDALPAGPEAEPTAPAHTPASAPATRGKVVVRRERKGRGGRTVTVVTGLANPDALAKALRKKLGVGAHVEGDDVVVQGDVSERVRDSLTASGVEHVIIGN